jgi:phosphatidylserine decarboxylase
LSEAPLWFKILRWVPRRQLSLWVGRLIHTRRPVWFAKALKCQLTKTFQIDFNEAEKPFAEYLSFGDLFARRLKTGARSFEDDGLLSPCDGSLEQWGEIESGRLIQCKGKDYELGVLLGNRDQARDYEGGYYMTIYLAPHNYHRVHWPAKGTLAWTRYLAGDRWPVNAVSVEHIDNLFCENERYVSECTLENGGRLSVVMVSATNVGDMELEHLSPSERKVLEGRRGGLKVEPSPKPIEVGDEHGVFKMGSTVILAMDKTAAATWDLTGLGHGSVKAGRCLGLKIH